ncbi:MAG: hypothetical protein EXS64_06895 [Candidatus Latescibacteria bacterium]|nr:hypothetical protein [Candidatus Latescibacterota bacterium]
MSDYLEFVKDGVQTLLERQSARLGGRPDGTPCITVSHNFIRTWRTLGKKDGGYYSIRIEGHPLEPEPYRLDMRIWPVLELFSEVTGDPQYRQQVEAMASAFGAHGFDPASGLGYLGTETQFDVLRLRPVYAHSPEGTPIFKPSLSVPLDRLWDATPEKMTRMFKAAYHGLITRPESMAYNRYCAYGFDDRVRKPSMAFNPRHVAFAQTGAFLIHWWGFHFARTGDSESLGWAQRMADKWGAVQDPASGLIPHCFTNERSDADTQPPRLYSCYGEMQTVVSLLRAVREIGKRPEGAALAGQVEAMARRLLVGMAHHGYIPEERVFPHWMYLDGRPCRETVAYCFGTQEEKDEAVKQDPILEEVAVYMGTGFYTDWPSNVGVQNDFPCHMALGARMTGDVEVLSGARGFAKDLMEAAGRLTGAFNAQGQWTYSASASYIKMLLLLFEATKERNYLDQARRLADMELNFLAQPLPAGQPEWWRMTFRDGLLEALLLLHRALADAEKREG